MKRGRWQPDPLGELCIRQVAALLSEKYCQLSFELAGHRRSLPKNSFRMRNIWRLPPCPPFSKVLPSFGVWDFTGFFYRLCQVEFLFDEHWAFYLFYTDVSILSAEFGFGDEECERNTTMYLSDLCELGSRMLLMLKSVSNLLSATLCAHGFRSAFLWSFRRLAVTLSLVVITDSIARAATLTVNTTADNIAGDNSLTLREAILLVNNGGNASAALGRSLTTPEQSQIVGSFGILDTIQFAASAYGTITLGSAELLIATNMDIIGPGPANLAIKGNACRVFNIPGYDEYLVSISGMVITNGVASGDGGGIYNSGMLTVSNCILSRNGNDGQGGGIYNTGTLTIKNCTLSRNSSGSGGGIFTDGTLTVSDCTLSGNHTQAGGGIYNGGGTVTISNSTFNENWALDIIHDIYGHGGGIFNYYGAQLAVVSCTFSDNSAQFGGAIFNEGSFLIAGSTLSGNSASYDGGGVYNTVGHLEIGNTILKASVSGGTIANEGTVTSRGYNVSSDAAGGDATTNPGGWLNFTGDQRNIDPLLDPAGLQNNGGPTRTFALLAGSPAIDKGKRDTITNLVSNTDQRGFPRPSAGSVTNAFGGDGSDIGAFEVQPCSDDTIPPSVPPGLMAAAASCNQVNLSWNASTDTGCSGLKGYKLYRGGTFLKLVLAPATSTSDTPVAPSTTNSYRVSAVDNADNESAQGSPAGATTPSCPIALPLTIGVLTVNGDQLTNLGNDRYQVSGNVTINGALAASQSVVCDFNTMQVSFSGPIMVNGNADPAYQNVFTALSTVAIDASTGLISDTSLNNISVDLKLAGLPLMFSNLKVDGSGVDFDASFTIPKLSMTANGNTAVAVNLTQLRLDDVSPYLHLLGATEIHIPNVFLANSGFGLESLDLVLDVPNKDFSGAVSLKLPSGNSIQGSGEIINGQLNSIQFGVSGFHIPIYTFTGGDRIYLTALSGGFDHLNDGMPFTLEAGTLDPNTFFVTQTGLGLSWGVGTVDAIIVDGAALWDTSWNMALGGQLQIFSSRFKVSDIGGRYNNGDKLIAVNGKLGIDDLFSLSGTFTTSFDANDRYFAGTAAGLVGLPTVHWGWGFIQVNLNAQVTGEAAFLGRATPVEKYLAGVRATANLPVLGERSVSYQYNMQTGAFSDTLDLELAGLLNNAVSSAQTRSVRSQGTLALQSSGAVIANGMGSNGMIVRLKGENGTTALNLRRPDSTLLTPQDADGVNIAYVENPEGKQTVYLLKSAEDGTWQAEFDDTGLGNWSVEFLTPNPPAALSVVAPASDTALFPTNSLIVNYASTNLIGDAEVRVYLDTDRVWGGGILMTNVSSLDQKSFSLALMDVAPGVYNVCVEVDPTNQIPLHAYSTGTLTVKALPAADLTGFWSKQPSAKCKQGKAGLQCSLKGKLTVQNNGAVASVSTLLRFYVIGNDGLFIQPTDIVIPSLAVGKTAKASLKVTLPSGVSASGVKIAALVDPDSIVSDSDRSNNAIAFGPLP